MKLNNKDLVTNRINKLGYKLGCYNTLISKLSSIQLKKVLTGLEQEHTDVVVTLNRKKYVVEIATVDNEKDLCMISAEEYKSRYGRET